MFTPIDKMSNAQLTFMQEWHESFAEMWDRKNETGMKRDALRMAATYESELMKRRNADTWEDDPDR
jgi:hypothetical protein